MPLQQLLRLLRNAPRSYGKAKESYVGLSDLETAADMLERGCAATGDSSLLEEQLVRLKESMARKIKKGKMPTNQ